jgi:hypothetical protein
MSISPLLRDLGVTQGLIDGAVVFGSSIPGVKYQFNTGDSVSISQTMTLTGLKLLRFTVTVRCPAVQPSGAQWVFEGLVNNAVLFQHPLQLGKTKTISDGVLDVSQFPAGDYPVSFRLKLLT